MRRPVTLVAAGLVVLGEAGFFGYLAFATVQAMTAPCPYPGGVDPCNGRYLGIFLIPLFAMVGLYLFAAAVLLLVWPTAISWTCALLVQCFFLDLVALLAVGLLLSDASKPRLVADLWSLFLVFWLWAPPSAGLLLLLVPSSLGACFGSRQ